MSGGHFHFQCRCRLTLTAGLNWEMQPLLTFMAENKAENNAAENYLPGIGSFV